MPAIADLPARVQALIDERRRYMGAVFAIDEALAGITAALESYTPKGRGRPPGIPTTGDESVPSSLKRGQRVPIQSLDVRLSPRQRQTLVALISGSTEKQIAEQLGVSPNTVHVHIRALYRLHEVNSRAKLLSRYISTRVVSKLRPTPVPTGESGAKMRKHAKEDDCH